MTRSVQEADWQMFKKIKEIAIERFCERALDQYRAIINDTNSHPHNRFLLLGRVAENQEKQMALIFDGHSRSKMTLQLYGMRMEGLVDDEALSQLSEDLRNRTDPERI